MSLHTTLTALRELMLVVDDVPQDRGARTHYFKTRYPELSAEACDDLAKISPQKLKHYRSVIVQGMYGTIQGHIPLTLAILSDRWMAAYGEPFSAARFMFEVQRSYPWRGYLTATLLESVYAYIIASCQSVIEIAPEILDIFTLERAMKELQRREVQVVPSLDMSQLTLEELFAMECRLGDATIFLNVSYPAYEALMRWKLERKVPQALHPQSTIYRVSRDSTGIVRVSEMTENEHAILLAHNGSVYELAEKMARISSEAHESEEEQLGFFLQRLTQWCLEGVIVLRSLS
jgi:hypothetical protein